ncbi:ankyrin repeat domain-containing protein [Catenovulum sediminis]|uniref:ankyrin repeat domain-containing protein n=1 Tax=Catenovulum sediminis TaxID=1740262 RepID=UPI00117C68BD|nr:ankyrin repeat domain-containing protein [Catenovulum sediminis]
MNSIVLVFSLFLVLIFDAEAAQQREIFTLISNKDINKLTEYYKTNPIKEIEFSNLLNSNVSVVVFAAMESNSEILSFYARQGFDLRKRHEEFEFQLGGNLLHDAASGCNMDTFSYLVSEGLDLQEPNDKGYVPLDIARMFQCPSIEQFILEKLNLAK